MDKRTKITWEKTDQFINSQMQKKNLCIGEHGQRMLVFYLKNNSGGDGNRKWLNKGKIG